MEKLIRLILEQIVNHPDEVEITKSTEESAAGKEFEIFTIHLNSEDIPLVIGRQGNTIKSIRNLVKIKAIRENRYIDVRVAD